MFNSFLDGTKSALEMAAISNGTGLKAPDDGLAFPPAGMDDLAHILRPRSVGGQLEDSGMVEVVTSIERDGRPVYKDLRTRAQYVDLVCRFVKPAHGFDLRLPQ